MSGSHPTARAWLVRADNPSPMTLEGTNTWVLVKPGDPDAIVIDPGPDDEVHRDAVMATVAQAGASRVALVLLTHGHSDHAAGAPAFAHAVNAPVRAAAPALCSPGQRPLIDREQVAPQLDVIATPGHTADSVCFVIGAGADRSGTADVIGGAALLTGDTILGRGTTVVARPDGRLADYLASLRRLRALVDERQLVAVLPGHGPTLDDPAATIDAYLRHREERLEQVQSAAANAATVDEVLTAVYGDVEPAVMFAARWSLLAQLDYLREEGISVPAE